MTSVHMFVIAVDDPLKIENDTSFVFKVGMSKDEEMLFQEHQATVLGDQHFVKADQVPLTPRRPVLIYVVFMNLYDFDSHQYREVIKIGKTGRSASVRFKEFAKDYHCRFVRPLMIYHTTISDDDLRKRISGSTIYQEARLKVLKSAKGSFCREFFKPSVDLIGVVNECMSDLKENSRLLYSWWSYQT